MNNPARRLCCHQKDRQYPDLVDQISVFVCQKFQQWHLVHEDGVWIVSEGGPDNGDDLEY